MPDLNTKIEAAKEEVASLKARIEKTQQSKRDTTLAKLAKSSSILPPRVPPSIKCRRVLKGHFGKITALHWGGDARTIASAGQDGNLLVWNAVTSNKVQSIQLKSSYVMSVGLEQSRGNLIACGGLDNLCSIYRRNSVDKGPAEMASHDGFLSCCRFIDETRILTSSGDSTCICWDVDSCKPLHTMAEHTADAMFMSVKPNDKHIFASCSVDQTVKVWDLRTPTSSVQTLHGHKGDVNAVEFVPSDGNVVVSCGQDATVRVFDLRAYNETRKFMAPPNGLSASMVAGSADAAASAAAAGSASGHAVNESMNSRDHDAGGAAMSASNANVAEQPAAGAMDGFASLAVSLSGRLIFAGHANGSVMCFDMLAEKTTPIFALPNVHERLVSCVGMSPTGDGLCTGSWDSLLKIWA